MSEKTNTSKKVGTYQTFTHFLILSSASLVFLTSNIVFTFLFFILHNFVVLKRIHIEIFCCIGIILYQFLVMNLLLLFIFLDYYRN